MILRVVSVYLVTALIGIGVASSCSDTEFSSRNDNSRNSSQKGSDALGNPDSNPGQEMPGQSGQSENENENPSTIDQQSDRASALIDSHCDVSGDVVSLSFNPGIQSCYDQDKVYNFAASPAACSEISFPRTFSCSWDALKAVVKGIAPSQAQYVEDLADKALIVACGESEDGSTVVVQWWDSGQLDSKDCRATERARLGSSCFRRGLSASANASARDLVDECLSPPKPEGNEMDE